MFFNIFGKTMKNRSQKIIKDHFIQVLSGLYGKDNNLLPYWIMNKELAEEFIDFLPSGLKSMKWDAGNSNFILKRITC